MNFEILCLDKEETVKSRTVKTLLYALRANDGLFENPTMDENKGVIKDAKGNMKLTVTQFATDKMTTEARYSVAFVIHVSSDDLARLDLFRVQLVDYIKSIGFTNIRILQDEVSETLAITLYPHIYKLENIVRTFIVNFFLKNLGTAWTKFVISADTLNKIKNRKNNDKIFVATNRVDSDVSLIDFDELGKILFGENSFLSIKKADNVSILINKISTATDLATLKSEVLEGTFYKYFKDCFTQKDFQNKWFELYYYRNKVAHNGTFSQDEVTTCIDLCDSISAIIDGAYEKLDTFKLSVSDQEALVIAVNEFASEAQEDAERKEKTFLIINEETLLNELKEAQEKLPFVGLKYFVVEWLGEKGYDYNASFTLINYLDNVGVIKLSKVDNTNTEHQITAIAIAENKE